MSHSDSYGLFVSISILSAGIAFSMTAFADDSNAGQADSTAPQPGLLKQEFVYHKAPFPQCHASTIAETKTGDPSQPCLGEPGESTVSRARSHIV